MNSLILAATLLCPAVQIENHTNTWNNRDADNMKTAVSGCKRNYSPKHCLVVFIKEAELTYVALCRKEGK